MQQGTYHQAQPSPAALASAWALQVARDKAVRQAEERVARACAGRLDEAHLQHALDAAVKRAERHVEAVWYARYNEAWAMETLAALDAVRDRGVCGERAAALAAMRAALDGVAA